MAKSVASKMIEIECPNCKAMLELDRGFAGGVCRCSKCGTLMTVPEDPTREKAETLSRPDAPPGGRRPASPPGRKAASPRPQTPAANNASRPGAPTPRINTPAQSPQQQVRPQSPAPLRPSAPTPSIKPAASAAPAPKPAAPTPTPPAPVQQQPSPQAAPQPPQTSQPVQSTSPAKPTTVTPPVGPKATPPVAPPVTPVTPEVEELEAEIIEDDIAVNPVVERMPDPVKTEPAVQPASPAEQAPAAQSADDVVDAEPDQPQEEHEEPHHEDPLHAADDEEVFQTASGKIIRVKKNRIVTAQTKRKVIRASIMTVIGIAVAGLLLIAFSVLYLITKDTGPTQEELLRQRQEAVNRTFGYDPNKNPFLMTQPNYLGIPLKKNFAVVIDASSSTQKWFGLAADAGPVGVKSANGAVIGIFAIAADGGPKFYPDTAKPIDQETAESIATNLMNTYPGGVGDIGQTVDATLANQPEQLIIVTDNTGIKPAMINKLKELLETRPELTLDIIALDSGRRNPELEKLVETHKGRYLLLTEGKIKDWRNETP